MIKIDGEIIDDFNFSLLNEVKPLVTHDGFMYIGLLANHEKNILKLIVWLDINDEQDVARWMILSNKENFLNYVNFKQSLFETIQNENEVTIFKTNKTGDVIPNSTILVKIENFPTEYKPHTDSFLKDISN